MSAKAKTSYAVMCLAAVFLALTGIGTFAFGNPPMTHWVLMAHVAAAPVFALGLAAVALTGSAYFAGCSDPPLSCAAKALFWLVLLCGLVVLLSGVVPMTPLFGTRGEHFLYLTHRYAGIVLAIAIALHIPACFCRAK